EIMEVFQDLNDKGLTIVLVTHAHDVAQFAKRVLVLRDGKIRKDDPVTHRPRAVEVLETLPTLEDAALVDLRRAAPPALLFFVMCCFYGGLKSFVLIHFQKCG